MPGRAQAESLKSRQSQAEKDALLDRAAAAYRLELDKPRTHPRRSSRKIARDFAQNHYEQTGNLFKLSHETIIQRANGRKSKVEAAQLREWLLPNEVEIVIGHIIKSAEQGFPLSHRRLKEDVDRIVRARLGSKFPSRGVGKKWTHRFVEKHSDRIKTSWSTPLETKRAKAANPNSNDAWWKLLDKALKDYEVKPENIYAVDEAGCQPYSVERERVIGGKQAGPQYQQRSGNRETMTVLVPICADGSALPPAVIFKGKGYQVKWKQDNPANASIGYSEKGWTDNEIGLDWLKLFEKQTAQKANGEWRMLLVDGHTSHYSLGFLEYARDHKIILLCYPSHTTHIYQGLDVVIFAVLKQALSRERDEWLRKNAGDITKENFLGIYGRAHLTTLTSENVKAAFAKTGVHPYDPSVVTPKMLAPSKTHSMQSNLAVEPPTPMKAVVKLLQNLSLEDEALAPVDEDDEDPPSPSEAQKTRRRQIVEDAARELAKSNLGYLLGNAPVSSSSPMIHPQATTILPPSQTVSSILTITPKTTNETLLLAALREATADNEALRRRVVESQAANILNEAYCNKLRFQLAAKEEKGKKKGKGKLMGDGLPRMLTGDEFYEKVVQFTEWQKEEEARKAAQIDNKALWQQAVKKWEEDEVVRKAENEAIKKRNKEKQTKWQNDKKAATKAKQTFSTPKPTPEKITRQPPKPKLKDFRPPVEDADDAASDGEALEVEGESSDESDADNDEDSDGDDQS
ncbi:hypothetical protein D9611_012962 [Ephemerocybe angulata]|uniref:HTH CENPB-type domain-containing protein n=1 Tax=Ephemerocybe angulata TaxID=980116 RepID=A0A8H5C4B4_9AGAR|nr:hypothetical protein D9611_012962 [Tulosesus angulatus]